MAEGFARHLKADVLSAFSAGTAAKGLDPKAVKVMAEVGVDISSHQSKNVSQLGERQFDYVVTVCGHANENCPFFPARTRVIHRGFDDPPRLAASARTEEEALEHYRGVRDEIKAYIETLPESLECS
jgi:arsenate reductase